MSDGDGRDKMKWERIIKENMVRVDVDGSETTYALNDRRNSSVEIHFGARYLVVPPRQPSKIQPTVGLKNDTFDISSADFLIVNRQPTLTFNKCKQFIPWKKILEIVFLNA